jgi:hypothetical protein
MRDGGFRPWCPKCDLTSSPGSRRCERCGFYLYPTSLPNGQPVPPVTDRILDDDDDEEAAA